MDINNDGFTDLIYTTRLDVEKFGLFIVTGNVDGFDPENTIKLIEDSEIGSLQIGDWNGDGQNDLMYQRIRKEDWEKETKILLLNELEISQTLSFFPGEGLDTYMSPNLVYTVDLDLDGHRDLIYNLYDFIGIVWGNSDHIIQPLTVEKVRNYGATTLSDINQDGLLDFLVFEAPYKSILIYLNQGNQKFQKKSLGIPNSREIYQNITPILYNDDIYPDLFFQTLTQNMSLENMIYIYNPETETYSKSDFSFGNMKTLVYPTFINNDEFLDFWNATSDQINTFINSENQELYPDSITMGLGKQRS